MAAYTPYTNYTTPELVATVIDVDAGDSLLSYVATAHQLVVDQCSASGYSADKLELIERWLAAHYYACNRRRVVSQAVAGAVSQTFDQVKADLRLNSTHYGQTAMQVDSAGNLAAYNNALGTVTKRLPVSGPRIAYLGTTPPNWWWRRGRCQPFDY